MSFFKDIANVTGELLSNTYLIRRLSVFAFFKQNRDAKLGILWNILTPATSIFVYLIVFGIGLRTGSPKKNIPFLPWLLCGISPWYFVSQSITKGANSIFRKSGIAAKIKFPLSAIPASEILTLLYTHMSVMSVVLIVLFAGGVSISPFGFQVLYYMLSAFLLMVSLSIFTSAISAVNRDFYNMLRMLNRLLFFITPIFWSADSARFSKSVTFIFKLNPIYYITEGYRDSLLYGEGFWRHPARTAYFWAFTLVLYLIGCNIHMVFRRRFNSM